MLLSPFPLLYLNFYYADRFPGLVLYFFPPYFLYFLFCFLEDFLSFTSSLPMEFSFLPSYFNFQRLLCILRGFLFIKCSILFLFHGCVASRCFRHHTDSLFPPRPSHHHVFVLICIIHVRGFLRTSGSQLLAHIEERGP